MTDQLEATRFTKSDSQYMKGIAILCMLMHHMFKPEHMSGDLFFPFGEGALVEGLGHFMQICVALFLFFSGVGLFHSKCSFRKTVKRVFGLYAKMWGCLLLLFLPVMLILHRFTFNPIELIKNLTAINTSYCDAWWFVILYAELVFVEWIFDSFLKKGSVLRDVLTISLMAAVSIGIYVLTNVAGIQVPGIAHVYQFCLYAVDFLLGFYAAKNKLLERIIRRVVGGNRAVSILTGVGLIASDVLIWYFLSYRFRVIPFLLLDWLLVSLFVVGVLMIRKSLPEHLLFKGIVWLGANSVWVWLIHDLFRQYLTRLTYFPRLPILVLLWVIILTVPVCLLMGLIYSLPARVLKARSKGQGKQSD